MSNLATRSAHARLFAIIILFALLPAWFFYIGIQYARTIAVLQQAPAIPLDAYIIHDKK